MNSLYSQCGICPRKSLLVCSAYGFDGALYVLIGLQIVCILRECKAVQMITAENDQTVRIPVIPGRGTGIIGRKKDR